MLPRLSRQHWSAVPEPARAFFFERWVGAREAATSPAPRWADLEVAGIAPNASRVSVHRPVRLKIPSRLLWDLMKAGRVELFINVMGQLGVLSTAARRRYAAGADAR